MTLIEFMDALQDAYERMARLLATSERPLAEGRLSDQAAQQFVTEADALLETLRQVRLDLDATDTTTWLVDPTDPQDWLNMAILEREYRSRMGRVSQALVALREQALQFVEGTDNVRVLANDEDTFQKIAQERLGDWTRWRDLIDANPALPVDVVGEGTAVVVPRARPRVRLG